MHHGKLVFAQLMEHLPLHTFRRCVARYPSRYPTLKFSHLDQFLCMAFAQLTFRESLRDIETCLRAYASKRYHLGIRGIAAELVGPGPLRDGPRGRVCEAASGVRAAHRQEPGDPAPARRELDGARGGEPDGVQGGLVLQRRQGLQRRSKRREVPCRRGLLRCLPAGGDDAGAASATRESTSRATCANPSSAASPQLILSFIAERVPGLPKSYSGEPRRNISA